MKFNTVLHTLSSVAVIIEGFDGAQREVIEFLHDWLVSDWGLDPRLRYGIPFYYGRSWICYLNPGKDDSVEFVFLRANELVSAQGVLDGRGRQQVAGIRIRTVMEIPLNPLSEILREAMDLDQNRPYRAKRLSCR